MAAHAPRRTRATWARQRLLYNYMQQYLNIIKIPVLRSAPRRQEAGLNVHTDFTNFYFNSNILFMYRNVTQCSVRGGNAI